MKELETEALTSDSFCRVSVTLIPKHRKTHIRIHIHMHIHIRICIHIHIQQTTQQNPTGQYFQTLTQKSLTKY